MIGMKSTWQRLSRELFPITISHLFKLSSLTTYSVNALLCLVELWMDVDGGKVFFLIYIHGLSLTWSVSVVYHYHFLDLHGWLFGQVVNTAFISDHLIKLLYWMWDDRKPPQTLTLTLAKKSKIKQSLKMQKCTISTKGCWVMTVCGLSQHALLPHYTVMWSSARVVDVKPIVNCISTITTTFAKPLTMVWLTCTHVVKCFLRKCWHRTLKKHKGW